MIFWRKFLFSVIVEWWDGIVFERCVGWLKYVCKVFDDELYFLSSNEFIVRWVGHDALRVNWGWLTETIDDEPDGCVDVDDVDSVIIVNLEYRFT